ncbi:uncharacterized protein LOC112053521 [Bicyclus anynana]|uniref:Uncharacterized protein LOC112053521 n=1 Tax=Bicyclus anynana TaxID=110368 RepID=A0A6J1NVC7_BICAN|nr:uncharacterized protein LOC112053521 [Bicyclus anynana]
MPNEDYKLQNVLHYSRKTFTNRNSSPLDVYTSRLEDTNDNLLESPRSDQVTIDADPGCSCENDPDGEIASILHKKCPVIALAQKQLDRLLDETDKLLCDNTRCCRSAYDFLILCKEALSSQNKWWFIILILLTATFFLGLILGAASCGTKYRKFNSPIVTCIDNFFIDDNYLARKESFRGII